MVGMYFRGGRFVIRMVLVVGNVINMLVGGMNDCIVISFCNVNGDGLV